MILHCNDTGGNWMSDGFDERARREGMTYPRQFALYKKFCDPETSFAGWDPVIESGESNPRFLFADAVGLPTGHAAIFRDFASGDWDPQTWYKSLAPVADIDYLNIPHWFDHFCRLHRISYPGQCLFFLVHPAHKNLNLAEPKQFDLITSFYRSPQLPRLYGKFAQALADFNDAGGPEFFDDLDS